MLLPDDEPDAPKELKEELELKLELKLELLPAVWNGTSRWFCATSSLDIPTPNFTTATASLAPTIGLMKGCAVCMQSCNA